MDPVTLAVVRGSLEQIADEMDLQLIHAAISPIISETNDCANGIFHPETGETIAQCRYCLPVFLAYMQFAVQHVIGLAREQGGFKPGDIWIMNDTYVGGSHLQDVQLVAPIFADGQLFAVLATTGHWMDIGGNVPGGWGPKATEIHQEGIVIPPVKLYEEGRLNEALLAMFKANVRLPKEIAGDLSAMVNVFTVGHRGIEALVGRYGRATLSQCLDEMIAYSERQMRSYIAEIPDGVYEITDYLDNDGITDEPREFHLSIEVTGSQMHLDFTGTSPACVGPINLSRNTSISSAYVALKHIFPDVPVNGGTFRPVTFTIPEGTVVSAVYPSPVSGYLEVVGRVIDTIFGALAKAIPDRVPAPAFGTTGVVTVAGHHPHRDDYYVGVFPYPGGYGGSASSDGQVHGTSPQSMANFMSLEVAEHRFPLRFDYFKMRDDSGGPGEHRGGDGTAYGFTVWDEVITSVLGDRVDHVPFGVRGGGDAAPNSVAFRTDGEEWVPPLRSKYQRLYLKPGDSVMVASPGGGGFGDPLDRPLDDVLSDLNRNVISRESAERDYGVRIAEEIEAPGRRVYVLDREGSEEERRNRRQSAQASTNERSE